MPWLKRALIYLLTHQAWYPCSTQNLNNPNLQTKTVADLINHSSGTWKPDLVRAMYPYPISEEIMSNPISKTGTVSDKLFWKFSNSGVFKVRNANNLLQEDTFSSCSNHHSYTSIYPNWYRKLIWKVKLPLKIGNFIWKLMHDSLPTLLTLKNRGIPTPSTCPLCSSDEESTSHLFLYCSFARATWHGTTLATHTSELKNISVQNWIGNLLLRHKRMDSVSMRYLHDIFTTLWTVESQEHGGSWRQTA